jgi:hypothetical protein
VPSGAVLKPTPDDDDDDIDNDDDVIVMVMIMMMMMIMMRVPAGCSINNIFAACYTEGSEL